MGISHSKMLTKRRKLESARKLAARTAKAAKKRANQEKAAAASA